MIELGLGLWQKYPYQRLVELVRAAEDAGYDVLWCANEKFYRDMWVMAGLVAAQTTRARIGTFIAEPYTAHPAMIATAIATLDEASDGRAMLLLGAGGVGFKEMNITRHKPVTAVQETIQIVRRMLAGEAVMFDGEMFAVDGAQIAFETRPDVPIWVASRGNRMLQMAGQCADGVMIATYATPTGIRAALNHVGRSPELFPVTVRVDVSIDEDANAARSAVKPMIAGMVKASFPNADFITQAGLEISPELHQNIAAYEFTELARAADLLPEGFVDAFAWAGTSAQVAEKVAAVLDMGISRITVLPHETATVSTETIVHRFIKEVVPDALAQIRG